MRIITSGYKLGSKTETLKELCKINPEWDFNKLKVKTGILTRHITSENENSETLALEAAKICLKDVDRNSIDGLIYVTQSPESTLPTRACILQNKLNLSNNILAFDINQGCSGFTYALSVATSLMKINNLSKILIICSDNYTSYISKNDRTSRPIFSDGAGAVVLDSKEEGTIGPFVYGTDGSGSIHLTLTNKQGSKINPYLFMNGPEVLKFTLRSIPKATNELLKKANLSQDDINMFIFHQASSVVLNKLQKKMNIKQSKWFCNLKEFGNTVSATIPIAINIAEHDKILKKGDNIMLMGFGVGLSYCGCIIKI